MALLTDGERQFHIRTTPEEVGRYVILPGDPGRVPLIAAYLENAEMVAQNREYCVYTGTLSGEKVTVCSTGIGGPSAAIAVEELVKCGADTFIRIGTSGGMDKKVSGGDLVVASAAVRGEGTTAEYLPDGYPAAADFRVVNAIADACAECCDDTAGNSFHVGVIHSKDSFYGEVEPENSPVGKDILYRWNAYLDCGCLASEMECAAVFAVGIARRVRCGGLLTALWNVERSKAGLPDKITNDSSKAIKCAVRAIQLLIQRDNCDKRDRSV